VGPTLFVDLPQPLSKDEVAWLHNWLSQSTNVLRSGDNRWDFWWQDKDSCESSLALIPFGTEVALTETNISEKEKTQYINLLGYLPTTSIQLDNFCRGDLEGHKLLAEIAALLAIRYNGVIGIGATIEKINTSSLAGKVYPISYEIGGKGYLVDGIFMKAWIKHPKFYLAI
jgi:hypothetical protein